MFRLFSFNPINLKHFIVSVSLFFLVCPFCIVFIFIFVASRVFFVSLLAILGLVDQLIEVLAPHLTRDRSAPGTGRGLRIVHGRQSGGELTLGVVDAEPSWKDVGELSWKNSPRKKKTQQLTNHKLQYLDLQQLKTGKNQKCDRMI